MAVSSYLPETIGGTLVAAVFAHPDEARAAIASLRDSGVRPQDISVIAGDRSTSERIAGDRAWTPYRQPPRGRLARLLARLPRPKKRLPKDIRRRYGGDIAEGRSVVVVVAGGQPPDTLRALMVGADGRSVQAWWSPPVDIFAPPEEAGPF